MGLCKLKYTFTPVAGNLQILTKLLRTNLLVSANLSKDLKVLPN